MAPNNGAGVTKNNTNWEQYYSWSCFDDASGSNLWSTLLFWTTRTVSTSLSLGPPEVWKQKNGCSYRVQTAALRLRRWDINGTKWLSWQFLNQNCILKRLTCKKVKYGFRNKVKNVKSNKTIYTFGVVLFTFVHYEFWVVVLGCLRQDLVQQMCYCDPHQDKYK